MVLLLSKMFEFAAPPRTGIHWFVRACQEANLEMFPDSHSVSASYLPWEGQAKKDTIRLSLVRHPCDWLRSVFDTFQAVRQGVLQENAGLYGLRCYGFDGLSEDNFDEFVVQYLERRSGGIGRIFDSYQADTRMRLEDMPWAFIELLESLGVEKKSLDRVYNLPPQARAPSRSEWQPDLKQQVLKSEAEFCQNLDYY